MSERKPKEERVSSTRLVLRSRSSTSGRSFFARPSSTHIRSSIMNPNNLDGENPMTPRRNRVGERSKDLSVDLTRCDDGMSFL